MNKELIELFDDLIGDRTNYDKKLYKSLDMFLIDYKNSNGRDQFFNSNLFGVAKVYFTDADSLDLHNILGISRRAISKGIDKVSCIDRAYKRESDPTNLILLYTAYRFKNNDKLSTKKQYQYSAKTIEVYYARQYSILLSAWLTFTTTVEIAQRAYEKLSYKFKIRRLANWGKVIEDYAVAFVMPDGRETSLKHFDCEKVKDDISAIRGAVASVIEGVYNKMVEVTKEDDRILNSSLVYSSEDGDIIKDVVSNHRKHITRVEDLVIARDTYEKAIIQIVGNYISSVNINILSRVIKTITDKKELKDREYNDKLRIVAVNTVSMCDDYINQVPSAEKSSIVKVVNRLKQYLTSSTNNSKFQQSREEWRYLLDSRKITLSSRQHKVVIASIQLYFYLLGMSK